MPIGVGTLVWQKWRHDWYMGQVIEQDSDDIVSCERAGRVKIHIHGEPETRDKWTSLPHANVIELVQVCVDETAVGVFPHAGDSVELLVVDAPLAKKTAHADETEDNESPLLSGTVLRVYPARDTSMVDVNYPDEYTGVPDGRRRVCIGNGYIRVRRNKVLPH